MLAPSLALADEAGMRVNEVVLSKGGSTDIQFIELENTNGTGLTNSGYGIYIYSATGTQAHAQPLVFSSQPITRIIVATAAARTDFSFGDTTGNPPTPVIGLGGDLPSVGTACFRQSGVDLHCMSWGYPASGPATAPTNGIVEGPTPGDGMSIQRQPTCAAVGAPTPNAPNASIPCPPPPADAGVDGGMNPGDDGGDEGCSVGAGASWLAIVGLAGLVVIGRTSRRRRTR